MCKYVHILRTKQRKTFAIIAQSFVQINRTEQFGLFNIGDICVRLESSETNGNAREEGSVIVITLFWSSSSKQMFWTRQRGEQGNDSIGKSTHK